MESGERSKTGLPAVRELVFGVLPLPCLRSETPASCWATQFRERRAAADEDVEGEVRRRKTNNAQKTR